MINREPEEERERELGPLLCLIAAIGMTIMCCTGCF